MELIQFPKILDARGNLTFIQGLPFPIRRVYYLYQVPDGSLRGGHAHRTLDRIFIAVAGRFKLNGIELRNPWEGLRVLPMTWVELTDFSNGAVCLVLASAQYDESDYIRDRVEFNRLTQISA